MADEQAERDVHQAVVQDDRAREPEARVPLAEPEQHAGAEEEQRQRCCDRRVDLLAGVEATLRRRPTARQPAQIVAVEPVELARRAQQSAPVAEEGDQDEHRDPAEPGVEVDVLDERPAAEPDLDARQIERETRRQQEEEPDRVRPVQQPLGAREAANVPRHVPYPFERPTQASRS